MQFNSYLFIMLFLPSCLAGYFGLHHMGKKEGARMFLAAMSLLFFAYGNPWYLVLLLASTGFNWRISRLLLGRSRGTGRKEDGDAANGRQDGGRKAILILGILANLGLLFYYKYSNFFLENLNLFLKQDLLLTRILLPVGISFFTFQQVAWLVDSYRGETGGYGFLD